MKQTSKLTSQSDTRDLIAFFLIAFGWTWLLQAPRVLANVGRLVLPNWLGSTLGYTAMWGPAVAASVLCLAAGRRPALAALWRRALARNFERRWLWPALLLIPVSALLTYAAMRLFDLPIAWEHSLSPAMIVPVFVLILLLNALPEEIGWRGYALDRLLRHQNALAASVTLGLLWALWHLPLHFIAGSVQSAIPVWQFLLQTLALTVIYTWLHNNTGGSVLVAILFHAMGNITGAVFPYWVSPAGRWIQFGLLLATVVLLVWRWGPAHLVRKKSGG